MTRMGDGLVSKRELMSDLFHEITDLPEWLAEHNNTELIDYKINEKTGQITIEYNKQILKLNCEVKRK